jgi:hypothetical protein
VFDQKSLQETLEYIKSDRDISRLVARVFFVNNLGTYFSFVKTLSETADYTVKLSDEQFCKGQDSVPDLNELISFLDANKDKDILVPNVAEYLRIGEKTEKNSAFLNSILNRHVHSKNRVWIPIFLAEELFQSVVGQLDEERFGEYLIEIDSVPSDFDVTVYSPVFEESKGVVNAKGVREWLTLWDNQKVKPGMSFSTRQIKQMTATDGDYSIKIIGDPYDYIISSLSVDNAKLSKKLGTNEQWASLIPYVTTNTTLEALLPRALNMLTFDPKAIIGNWKNLKENEKWTFFLWYKLGLNKESDYISFAVSRTTQDNLIQNLESAIFECLDNAHLEEWINQRDEALKSAGYRNLSSGFLKQLDNVSDTRIKLKILTNRTHEERTKIIELVSQALKQGKSISDYKTLLQEKLPDLLLYLRPSAVLSGEIKDYITQYKNNKISDDFSLELSSAAGKIDCLNFDTRGSILFSLKNKSCYFLWFDGLGIEWIDMLLEKIKTIDSSIASPKIDIGTAVLPTITEVNMDKADPETISEKKVNDLDTLSHIKDKSDCNYYSIIDKQFELIEVIAQRIVNTIKNHPDMEIVVTADHGMSRMAAKGFHLTQGVNSPNNAIVSNHGRYCTLSDEDADINVTNTKKEGKVLAFSTYNHFTSSGNAPGEIHGGASPEELLVPIIRFSKINRGRKASKPVKYRLVTPDVYLDNNDKANITIQTDEPADSLIVEFNGKNLTGDSSDKLLWNISIDGLTAGNSYTIRVCPNNIYSQNEETIIIKRKGLVIDDDF